MNRTRLLTILTAAFAVLTLVGCAGDSYNGYNSYGYDNRDSYDKQIDYEAHKDVAEASKMLSEQDIQDIQNLKK